MQDKLKLAVEIRTNIAKIYADIGEYEYRISQLSNVGDLYEKIGNITALKEIYKKIIEIYEERNNTEKAKEWRKKLKKIKPKNKQFFIKYYFNF